MKKLFLSMFCCLMMLSVQSFAQDDAAANPEMEAWTKYMTPGKMHEMLASGVGEWTTKATLWMEPGAEPSVSEGTSTAEMILGGRYMKEVYHGNMMGMEFEGITTVAFDNATQEFISTWIDNMGTGIMVSKGKFNEETNKVEMEGTFVDPMTSTEKPFRQTMEMIDDNHQRFEMFMPHEGKEFKTMVIEYTRKTGM
jgi:hypothetical protein